MCPLRFLLFLLFLISKFLKINFVKFLYTHKTKVFNRSYRNVGVAHIFCFSSGEFHSIFVFCVCVSHRKHRFSLPSLIAKIMSIRSVYYTHYYKRSMMLQTCISKELHYKTIKQHFHERHANIPSFFSLAFAFFTCRSVMLIYYLFGRQPDQKKPNIKKKNQIYLCST